MTKYKFVRSFINDDHGAITVDFVVLTAAICTLGLVVVTAISGGATGLANDTEEFLENTEEYLANETS